MDRKIQVRDIVKLYKEKKIEMIQKYQWNGNKSNLLKQMDLVLEEKCKKRMNEMHKDDFIKVCAKTYRSSNESFLILIYMESKNGKSRLLRVWKSIDMETIQSSYSDILDVVVPVINDIIREHLNDLNFLIPQPVIIYRQEYLGKISIFDYEQIAEQKRWRKPVVLKFFSIWLKDQLFKTYHPEKVYGIEKRIQK